MQRAPSVRFIIGWVVTGIGGIIAVAAVAVSFWVFAIDRYDPVTQKSFDGFGREHVWYLPGMHGPEGYRAFSGK